ncbi:hypothetical protein DDZ14_13755 [Maritimibacter sp. 55A14]|nr:hypothetical protein DDZ14_13755 [Maritimibacter sp. 55A14]
MLIVAALMSGLFLIAPKAQAHCDSLGGPVATAAGNSLQTGNVNLVLRYVPVTAEAEVQAAFAKSRAVRAKGGVAQELADRFFIETAVRLHRDGEGAPYTGLKTADMDFGPAIPAAERALESGATDALEELLVEEVRHAIQEKFHLVKASQMAAGKPETYEEVAAARARASAELEFVGFVEEIFLSTKASHIMPNKPD